MSYYSNTIHNFLLSENDFILGSLTTKGGNDPNDRKAWEAEIQCMKNALDTWKDETGEIIFEYTIPRLAKRVDVILLLRNIVFTIEFKAGKSQYLQEDMEQVMDYALDLKNFHKESQNKTIVPILIPTEAKDYDDSLKSSVYDDHVYDPILITPDVLNEVIKKIIEKEQAEVQIKEDLEHWLISRYEPTPTIIEAARALYIDHNVENITRTEASGETLKKTTDYIIDIINRSKAHSEKSICFVTGVPGAGKTLVGLNVAIQQSNNKTEDKSDLAVYLSGNGPLVKVLTEALARDKQARDKKEDIKTKISDARRSVKQFIQEIYNYREQMLNKIKTPIVDGKLEIDETRSMEEENSGHAEIEHVAIFDEAQRSWDHEKLASWLERGGSYGNKRKVANFPMSEAEFLIWSLNLRKDWAVIVCLVGGGQEIHTGEAGISEWIRAINESFPDWKVYVSDHLEDKEYAEGHVKEMLQNNPNAIFNKDLHLSVSMRSFRAEKLSLFVHYLLNKDVENASLVYKEIKEKYPIVLTRDLDKAKNWLKNKARGSERFGMIVSSKAERLRPLAIDVKRQTDVVKWFLDDKRDIQSSFYLEDVATEFDVQGLELDWTCLVWDGDLRYENGEFKYFYFKGNKWYKNRQENNQAYQLNAYRVLLTRARQGMVICVPFGSKEDATRKPEFYDGIYQYLKSIGLDLL